MPEEGPDSGAVLGAESVPPAARRRPPLGPRGSEEVPGASAAALVAPQRALEAAAWEAAAAEDQGSEAAQDSEGATDSEVAQVSEEARVLEEARGLEEARVSEEAQVSAALGQDLGVIGRAMEEAPCRAWGAMEATITTTRRTSKP